MNRIIPQHKNLLLAAVLVLAISLMVVVGVAAQTGFGFDLSWNVIAAGGGRSTLTGYELNGTIGQTAVSSSSGSGDVLAHGFWQDLIDMLYSMLPFTVKH
jgi:hypothetical protein